MKSRVREQCSRLLKPELSSYACGSLTRQQAPDCGIRRNKPAGRKNNRQAEGTPGLPRFSALFRLAAPWHILHDLNKTVCLLFPECITCYDSDGSRGGAGGIHHHPLPLIFLKIEKNAKNRERAKKKFESGPLPYL